MPSEDQVETRANRSERTVPADVLYRIARALEGLRFGSIEIQVHDARVVRITRTEKVRIEDGERTPE